MQGVKLKEFLVPSKKEAERIILHSPFVTATIEVTLYLYRQ